MPKAPMFRVTQEIEFCYGHRLLNYSGKCRYLHGHNGLAVIVLEGPQLDQRGMLVDFTDIKSALRTWIDRELDHRMILHEADPILPTLREMGEPVYVIPENPTAENIARLIYEQAHQQKFPVLEVALWETPKACATYRG
jgi:6-pyruvoyltetrahydropterin/6-carboxytetrahydropterin synthase